MVIYSEPADGSRGNHHPGSVCLLDYMSLYQTALERCGSDDVSTIVLLWVTLYGLFRLLYMEERGRLSSIYFSLLAAVSSSSSADLWNFLDVAVVFDPLFLG